MRKIAVSIIALLVSSMTLMAERVSREDAALVANNFMNVATATTTDGVMRVAPAKRMVLKQTTEETESQYFIYENESGEGWVIIAANDAVEPILAYSETGHFRTDNMPSNIRNWMGKYDRFIKQVETDGVEATEETQAAWTALRQGVRRAKAEAVVSPLLQTQWDQEKPYNKYCPGTGNFEPGTTKAATGCVATAMAQVMKYWEWPIKGAGSHTYHPKDVNRGYDSRKYDDQTADFENTTYDWDNMLDSYKVLTPAYQQNAVATLMYHCGVATEMMYGSYDDDGSGTYTLNYGDESDHGCAQNALWMHFRYKKATGYMRDGYRYGGHTYYEKWTDDDWAAMIKEELDKQRPILYGGGSYSGGHSFVCDGYDSNDKFHFNWGWSGSNDGYYTLSSLRPGSGGAGGGSYNFSENQEVLIGIEPDWSQAIETVNSDESVLKTIINGHVVIVRDNKMYDLMGQRIQ